MDNQNNLKTNGKSWWSDEELLRMNIKPLNDMDNQNYFKTNMKLTPSNLCNEILLKMNSNALNDMATELLNNGGQKITNFHSYIKDAVDGSQLPVINIHATNKVLNFANAANKPHTPPSYLKPLSEFPLGVMATANKPLNMIDVANKLMDFKYENTGHSVNDFWHSFKNHLLSIGFSETNSPFIHSDFLHKNPQSTCSALQIEHHFNMKLNVMEIMLNSDKQIVMQLFSENKYKEIGNEKLIRFTLIDDNDELDINLINDMLNQMSDLLKGFPNVSNLYCKESI